MAYTNDSARRLFEGGDRCSHLREPSLPQFTLSCVLMAWVFISYIPQYARIVSRRSAEGLSTLYVLLGALSGVCAVGNIMMLPSSSVEISCCRSMEHMSRFACVSGLLGMFQVIFGIICFWIVLFMYVYYSEEEAAAELHGHRPSLGGPERTFRQARRAWIVLLAACGFAFLVLVVSAVISRRFPPAVGHAWADILGVAVAVLACVQWVPQAATTWKLGHLGSLSLASLCLSAPYTWLFGINMALRVGFDGWSAWIVYLLVGTMQVVLIGLGISFKIHGETAPHEVKHKDSIVSFHFDGWGEHFNVPEHLRQLPAFRVGSFSRKHSGTSSHIAPDERRPLLASNSPAPDRGRGRRDVTASPRG